jgi:small subunit ribosomal protein S8
MTSDSIADMLTRIRNANQAHHRTVEIPVSKMKVEIARVLTEEGFVEGYEVSGEAPMQLLTVTLKPGSPRGRALSGLRRISRPGLRVYARKSELPRVLGGLGVAIISTSRGLMTGRAAQRAGLGGEVVAFVW